MSLKSEALQIPYISPPCSDILIKAIGYLDSEARLVGKQMPRYVCQRDTDIKSLRFSRAIAAYMVAYYGSGTPHEDVPTRRFLRRANYPPNFFGYFITPNARTSMRCATYFNKFFAKTHNVLQIFHLLFTICCAPASSNSISDIASSKPSGRRYDPQKKRLDIAVKPLIQNIFHRTSSIAIYHATARNSFLSVGDAFGKSREVGM